MDIRLDKRHGGRLACKIHHKFTNTHSNKIRSPIVPMHMHYAHVKGPRFFCMHNLNNILTPTLTYIFAYSLGTIPNRFS